MAYSDRQTLWNEVEKVERRYDAQLAYSFDVAQQNELTFEEDRAHKNLLSFRLPQNT